MSAKAKGMWNEHGSIRLLEAASYQCTGVAGSLGGSTLIALSYKNMWSDRMLVHQ
jgi:hypothetical protein